MTGTAAPPALSTRDLSVRFGGVVALEGVSLDVASSGMTGLIGPNGAGKSTFIDAVTGFLPSRAAGSVLLGGRDVSKEPPHRRAHLGLGRTWQSLELFEDCTVAENLQVAARRQSALSAVKAFARRPAWDDTVAELISFLGLDDVADREPRDLTQRQRKLVGLARSMVGKPLVALMDEPAAGLDRAETAWLAGRLRRLVEGGTPILLVDHDMGLVLEHCERVIVLDQGRLLADGTPAEVRADQSVVRAYLGTSGGGV